MSVAAPTVGPEVRIERQYLARSIRLRELDETAICKIHRYAAVLPEQAADGARGAVAWRATGRT